MFMVENTSNIQLYEGPKMIVFSQYVLLINPHYNNFDHVKVTLKL